ncbi:hypothetical protein [Coxiella burnetii]|uniref:hypothetical protein n=1 Tax=Coxiella burnetii TaxID=777 RepID=UPI0000183869|nr:hypothetical protein [Coxiella burnetii]ARI65835.1 hypothetical protein B7L74_05195 [Coxiella burnetii]ARK27305.1 hypothetical protein BMW92_05035 [Coxiella burnetii]MCF2092768.1 hypothetical protein [Coxiella burnetii]MCF2095036.1 hypothetical protein [Coxiella burnetii]MCF2096837.1 hypothetical protein [Coxiella burnetii]
MPLLTYKFDRNLNSEKVFQYTPPPEINLSEVEIPDNWLEELTKICLDHRSDFSPNLFEKHIGETSSYRSMQALKEQLQLIYCRLTGRFDKQLGELSSSNRLLLLSKLLEDIKECSEGFHIRVNIITYSLQKPSTLNHLLYNIRKHLVEQVAFSLTIAVHTWNYVITIAMADGFGIKANLENDPNQVHLSGNEIRNALQKRFEKEYTLFHLPSLLGESLKGLLVELGYQGQKEEGQSYTNGETNDFLDCITVFFPASDSAPNDSLDQKYFVIDENSCIRDINWSFIYQAFFQKLIKEDYSKKNPQPRNLLDCAQAAEWAFVSHNDLFERANRHISLLLEKNKYSILIKQLHEIQSQFPTYYLELTKNQTLIQKIPSIITYLTQQFQQDKKLSSALIQMFQLLTVMNINSMVNYTHLLQELVTKRCYFHVDYFDSISLAVIDQPEVVPIVLEFLSKYKQILGDKTLIQLLSHTNRFGFNLLMLSLNSRKNSVFRILNFMAEHKEFIGVKTLKRVLTQKTSTSFNIIELGEHQPKIIEFLLKFISTHQRTLTTNQLKKYFLTPRSSFSEK